MGCMEEKEALCFWLEAILIFSSFSYNKENSSK